MQIRRPSWRLLAWPQKLRRAVYHRPDHRRDFLFTQDIVDGFGNSVRPRSGIRPHVRAHDLDRIRPAQETACERSCFRFVCTRCSLPANLDKAHKGGGVTVVAHQHQCGRSAPILKLRRISAAHSWHPKAQVDQSSHSQEIFYVYITQQAYHDEEVNPTPTHEGRTVVHQEMFSVHSQQ